MRRAFEIITGLLIGYGAIGLLALFLTGGQANILPGPLVDRVSDPVPRGYSND